MAGENVKEGTIFILGSESSKANFTGTIDIKQNLSTMQDLVPCEYVVPSNPQNLASTELETCATGHSLPTPQKKTSMETLPTEILMAIMANMNGATSACLGLTCSRIYSVHFALKGPTPLHHKSRRQSRSWVFAEEVALKYLIEDWMSKRKYSFCLKHFIFVPKGSAWSLWNWMPSEKNSEEYAKAVDRRKLLTRRGIWNREQDDGLESAERAMCKRQSRRQQVRQWEKDDQMMAMAKQNSKGTQKDFERMHELIGYALKAQKDGLIKKWDNI